MVYGVDRHRLNRGRFLAVGNGPDQPVADNRTAQGRELNRRTDFKIIKNAHDSAADANVKATPPTAEDNQPMISGNIDKTQVLNVLRQNVAAFRACYTAGLEKKPGLAGRVVLKLTIDPQGQVSESQATSSTLAEPTVEKCLTLAAQRMQFPNPGGTTVRINYPLSFKPEAARP